MSDRIQLIKLVKDFIKHADELLEKKQIDPDTYFNITKNKVDFLKKVEKSSFIDNTKACASKHYDNINIY